MIVLFYLVMFYFVILKRRINENSATSVKLTTELGEGESGFPSREEVYRMCQALQGKLHVQEQLIYMRNSTGFCVPLFGYSMLGLWLSYCIVLFFFLGAVLF